MVCKDALSGLTPFLLGNGIFIFASKLQNALNEYWSAAEGAGPPKIGG
jgi:hypothetical protein